MKAKQAGILSALLATGCCVGPLLLVAIGLGGVAAFVGRYHWIFFIGGMAVLTWAWARYLREKKMCDCEHKTVPGRRSGIFTLLLATVIVLGFGSLNISRYVFASAPASAQIQTQLASGLNHVVIPVEGMSCVTCEVAVRHALRRVDGVKSARVSVATKTVTVDYAAAKANPKQLVAAINSTGYRASLPNKMNGSASMAENKNTNDTEADPAPANTSENAAVDTADRMSLFKASLKCPAALELGCGSAAKPILLDLERQPGVLEAWLNRGGTTIAVVWKPDSGAEARRNVAAELKEDHAIELEGVPRDDALKDFSSGKGWYRGADVDRLSKEEADIIAARLVRRMEAKTALTKDKAQGVRRALADAFEKLFTSGKLGERAEPFRLKDVAGQYLDDEQIKILKEAIDRGVQPLPNES